MNKEKKSFTKTDKKVWMLEKRQMRKIKDANIIMHLDNALRFLEDVGEELTNISFYNKLDKEKII